MKAAQVDESGRLQVAEPKYWFIIEKLDRLKVVKSYWATPDLQIAGIALPGGRVAVEGYMTVREAQRVVKLIDGSAPDGLHMGRLLGMPPLNDCSTLGITPSVCYTDWSLALEDLAEEYIVMTGKDWFTKYPESMSYETIQRFLDLSFKSIPPNVEKSRDGFFLEYRVYAPPIETILEAGIDLSELLQSGPRDTCDE